MLAVALDNVIKRLSHAHEPAAMTDLLEFLSGQTPNAAPSTPDAAVLCGSFVTAAVVGDAYLEASGAKGGSLDTGLLGEHFSHTVELSGLAPADVSKYARAVKEVLRDVVHKNLCSAAFGISKQTPKPILTIIRERGLLNVSSLGPRLLGVECPTGAGSYRGGKSSTMLRSAGVAEGVAAAILEVEALASMAKALSVALLGSPHLAPQLAVVIVAGNNAQQLLSTIGSSCRGTLLRHFAGVLCKPRELVAASSGIPAALAEFLFHALALAPVVVGGSGLAVLAQAWAASQRLTDVATAFHSLVSPFENLRSCETAAQLLSHVEVEVRHGVLADLRQVSDRSRAGQLIGNAGALNVLFGHAAAVEERTGSLARGISVFANLYELLCREDWAELGTFQLFRPPPVEGHISGKAFVAALQGQPSVGVPDDVKPIVQLDITHMLFPTDDPAYPVGVRTEWFPPLTCPEISANRVLVTSLLDSIQLVAQPKDGEEFFSARKRPRGPVLSGDFYHPIISDAVRVLYVLVCHELRAKGQQGSWVSLQRLTVICCFGDSVRCLRAVYHLSLCRTVQLNMSRLIVRSRCI